MLARYVKLLRDAFDARALTMPPVSVPNVLELARTVLRVAGAAKSRLLPSTPLLPAALDHGIVPLGPSPAERLAQQVTLNACSKSTCRVMGLLSSQANYRHLSKITLFLRQVLLFSPRPKL